MVSHGLEPGRRWPRDDDWVEMGDVLCVDGVQLLEKSTCKFLTSLSEILSQVLCRADPDETVVRSRGGGMGRGVSSQPQLASHRWANSCLLTPATARCRPGQDLPASPEFPGGAYMELRGKVASPGRANASREKVVSAFLASAWVGSPLAVALIFARHSDRKSVR